MQTIKNEPAYTQEHALAQKEQQSKLIDVETVTASNITDYKSAATVRNNKVKRLPTLVALEAEFSTCTSM